MSGEYQPSVEPLQIWSSQKGMSVVRSLVLEA